MDDFEKLDKEYVKLLEKKVKLEARLDKITKRLRILDSELNHKAERSVRNK